MPSVGINEQKSHLYFSENPLEFDPPLVKKKNVYFIPIRSLTSFFDGDITRSKKDHSFNIQLKNIPFKIKPNVKKYTINNQTKIFKHPPFIYKTRLYVPLIEYLENFNISIIKKNNHFYAIDHTPTSPELSKKIPLSYPPYNDPSSKKNMFLPISKQTLPIKTSRFHGKEKTDITDFIRYLGYKIETIDHHFLLKKNNIVYAFKTNSNQVKLIQNKTVHTKTLSYKPTIKNQRFYVSLKPFLNDLGFDYIATNDTITILKKLNNIRLDNESKITLNKNSRIKIGAGHTLNNPPRIFWDFGFTKCPNHPIKTQTPTIKKITFGQKKTTCRMVVHFEKNHRVLVSHNSPISTSFSFEKTTPSKKIPRHKQITQHQQSLRGKVIIIDPGHGGSDPGAVTKTNDYEKYYTLDISKRIQTLLQKKGAKTILLRSNDSNPSLYQRVKKINRSNGDFLISVHINSFINSIANGSETYYYKQSEKLAAKYVQKHLAKQLKLKNNGVKHAKMYILRYSKIPGVLIEPCFMTNKHEYTLLKTNAFKQKIAKATVDGVEEYFKNK